MAIVDKYVVEVLKTHGKYGQGDKIGLNPAQYQSYQTEKRFQDLVRLLHIQRPNGDHVLVDEDGQPTANLKTADVVKRENEIRSTVHHLIRVENLTKEDEERLSAKAIADVKLDLEAFMKDPEAYFQGKTPPPKPGAVAARPR